MAEFEAASVVGVYQTENNIELRLYAGEEVRLFFDDLGALRGFLVECQKAAASFERQGRNERNGPTSQDR